MSMKTVRQTSETEMRATTSHMVSFQQKCQNCSSGKNGSNYLEEAMLEQLTIHKQKNKARPFLYNNTHKDWLKMNQN